MKNFKSSRNMSLFAGFCFLIAAIIQLVSNQFLLAPILNVISCICFFINAYISHEKITKDNKDEDNEQ